MRLFKRFFLVFLIVLVLVPAVALQFFGTPIARSVVRAVNNNFRTEIRVGEYDVSLLRNFPKLSVEMLDVVALGSDGSELLVAEAVSFTTGFGAIFGRTIVDGIVVQNATLQLLIDRDGNGNYLLTGGESVAEQFEEVEEGAGAGAMEFAIRGLILDNVAILYRDEQLNVDANLLAKDIEFNGDFGAANYGLSTTGELNVLYLDQDGERYLDREELILDAQTTVDNVNESYSLSPLSIEAGDLELTILGDLKPTLEGLDTRLNVTTKSGNLDDVLALIPPAYAAGLDELETRGELDLSANVNGSLTSTTYPRIDGRLRFSDGRLGSPRINVGAKNLELIATLAYLDGPRGGVQTFAIERFTGTFRGQPFEMALSLEDLDEPRIDFSANGSFPMATLPAFLEEGTLTNGGGFLRIDGLHLRGNYADMIRPRGIGRVRATGTVRAEDVELTVNDRELSFPEGRLRLENNRLIMDGLAFEAPGTELLLNGEATNLIPVLFADSLNSQDARLQFTADLSGESLDIDELLALSGPTEEEIEQAEATGRQDSLARKSAADRARVTDLLEGTFEATFEAWNWDELEGENFRGQLIFSPKELDVRGLTEAMDGEVKLAGEVYFQEIQRIEARVSAFDVDAEAFFAQNANFDQEVLTSDNLEGEMDARLLLSMYYDPIEGLDYDRLRARGWLKIEDGELHDFEMLENFGFALKQGDLDRVRFTELENYFEIRDQTIVIPVMFIQSSAMNLSLSGRHTFDQELDYYIKVNAGQVLANKISRHDRDLNILPARNGLFNLYYTVRGPLETFEVESNKRAVKRDFERSRKWRDAIRAALADAFAEPIRLLEEDVATEDVVTAQ